MSAPLPEVRRARFQKLVEEGLSGRAAALRFKLSPATGGAHRGVAIRRTGQSRAAMSTSRHDPLWHELFPAEQPDWEFADIAGTISANVRDLLPCG